MNVAFSAIIFLLLILPGFLARSAFWRSEKQNLDFSPFSAAMASVIIISGGLHALWIFLLEKCTSFSLAYTDLLSLLAAQTGKSFQDALGQSVRYPQTTFVYFATIYAFATVSGHLLRLLVRKFRLDRQGWMADFVKFDTPWYYLFRDLEPGVSGTWVNALVDMGSKTFMFSGIVEDFHVDKDGGLDRIILIEASQQQVNNKGQEQECEGEQEEIQGIEGKLVLRFSVIKTMTVVKFSLEEEEP